jgi:di/tricarboxylate transporter
MLYGPGGYRFGDYARLGMSLAVMVLVRLVVVLPLMWAV